MGPEFETNFVKLSKVRVNMHDIPDNDLVIYPVDSTKLLIFSLQDICINGVFRQRFWADYTIKRTIYESTSLGITKYTCDSFLYPFLNPLHHRQDIQNIHHVCDSVRFLGNKRYTKSNFVTRLEQEDNSYYMVHYGNRKILQRLLSHSNHDHQMTKFLNILFAERNRVIELECIGALQEIIETKPQACDESYHTNILKDTFSLYKYQKQDIIWMNKIKDSVDKGDNSLCISRPAGREAEIQNNKYIYNDYLLPYQSYHGNTLISCKYYGGNLISQVGLGKTITSLCYILDVKNDFDRFVEFSQDKCNYFFKRGKNKSGCCPKLLTNESSLYCKEHCKTPFMDKRQTKLKDLDVFNLRDYVVEKLLPSGDLQHFIKTNASIVLCPNHLCDQWVREYYDKFKQDALSAKRVLLIVTQDQYNNLTFADILFADLIIVSYNFLTKKAYINLPRMKVLDILDNIDADVDIVSIEDVLKVHQRGLNVLSNFMFKNRILDESHEIIDSPGILLSMIDTIHSLYTWNITATPFPKGVSSFVHNIAHTLHMNKLGLRGNDYLTSENIKAFAYLYRRNTRETIQNEYTGNVVTEEVKLLEFTQQERHIYDAHIQGNIAANKDFLIKLCCDTSIDAETRNLVKNCKTLDEIQNVILTHNKKMLIALKKSMSDIEKRIDELMNIITRGFIIDETDEVGDAFESLENVKGELSVYRRHLTNKKKTYDGISRTYQYLKNAIDSIKELETCPICLDDIDVEQISITKCGHKFCQGCIKEYIEEIGRNCAVKCPKCNVPISVCDIFLLKNEVVLERVDDDLSSLVQRTKSTKIGNIVHYLKTQLAEGDKCIVFSQWDTMLSKVGRQLVQENVDVMFCTGTIYQKNSSIKAFQENAGSKVICLSSENCASGINLTAANKILLIEPVYGSVQNRKDVENQACGRANRLGQKRPIEIVRFIVKDTIEEDILKENKEEDEKGGITVLEI